MSDPRCFWFGHMPAATIKPSDALRPAFECRRCGKSVLWSTMPRAIRVRIERLHKLMGVHTSQRTGQ